MIRTWIAGAALALGIGSVAMATPEVGAEAPAFTGMTTAGEEISLSDFEGKKVVLEWTNHDCPFVVKHYGSGNMQATQQSIVDDGAIWISVISSAPGKQGYVSPAEADELTTSRGAVPTYVMLDPEGTIGHAYEAKTTPHMYIIDEGQTLQYMGAIDSIRSARPSDIPKATNYVTTAWDALQAGEAIDPASTTAYGCTVKYK